MEPHLFRVKPGGGSGESYSHEGEEFLHILRGDFENLGWTARSTTSETRDSLYFESSTPHAGEPGAEKKHGCVGSTHRQHSDCKERVAIKNYALRLILQTLALVLGASLRSQAQSATLLRGHDWFHGHVYTENQKTPVGAGRGHSQNEDRAVERMQKSSARPRVCRS